MTLQQKIRLELASLFMKWANHLNSRFVELACFSYVAQHQDAYEEWAFQKLRDRAYDIHEQANE